MALFLLKREPSDVEAFGRSIIDLRNGIRYCRECRNISDSDLCDICSSPRRDHGIVCVVEDIRDVMAIENTGQFDGVYHVLGGIISPMEGVGPQDLQIESLGERVSGGDIRELILALPTTIEGDTTGFYLFRRLSSPGVKITTIARGVSVGDELEHADEVTLGRAMINRMPFESR